MTKVKTNYSVTRKTGSIIRKMKCKDCGYTTSNKKKMRKHVKKHGHKENLSDYYEVIGWME